MKGLLTLDNISCEKLLEIIKFALEFKNGYIKKYENLSMATLFYENSTRTKYSFHKALINLGINVIDINPDKSSVQKGESMYDTIKTLESIGFNGVVIRDSKDEYFKDLKGINIPIFNGGDGAKNHPTQCLLDLMTIYEEFGYFKGLNICICGDISHSRVAHTHFKVLKDLGLNIYLSGPKNFIDYDFPYITMDEACKICDCIMLLRVQFERHNQNDILDISSYNDLYGLNKRRYDMLKDKAIIMHPAPVNRDIEISSELVEEKKSRIFRQMQNGVFVRMAVISMVLEGKL